MLRLVIALVALAVASSWLGLGSLAATFSWAAQLVAIVFVLIAVTALIVNAAGGTVRPV